MVKFYLHCKWGRKRLKAHDLDDAVEMGTAYAVRNGMSVVITDGDDNDLAYIPPTITCDTVPYLLFGAVRVTDLAGLN